MDATASSSKVNPTELKSMTVKIQELIDLTPEAKEDILQFEIKKRLPVASVDSVVKQLETVERELKNKLIKLERDLAESKASMKEMKIKHESKLVERESVKKQCDNWIDMLKNQKAHNNHKLQKVLDIIREHKVENVFGDEYMNELISFVEAAQEEPMQDAV
ncbi:hypothetical protein HDE_09080 [Halotydeus destructor]|nr:hypothetical protein HDE_09080 [Halotydeus destructor]